MFLLALTFFVHFKKRISKPKILWASTHQQHDKPVVLLSGRILPIEWQSGRKSPQLAQALRPLNHIFVFFLVEISLKNSCCIVNLNYAPHYILWFLISDWPDDFGHNMWPYFIPPWFVVLSRSLFH